MTRQRLHKLMAACGVGSRRSCEDLIRQGRVEVDGRLVTELGVQVDPETQKIRCDGQFLRPEPLLHFLLNKPRGAICSMNSAPGKPRAVDFLPPRGRDRRLFTIGRLDVDSDGALILTNDGELCHLVSHPRYGVHKTYRVEVEGVPDAAALAAMRKGVWLHEGRTGEMEVELVHAFRERALLAVRLQEGKRREIRRVCARCGHEVRRLTRMSIGPIELGGLQPGEVRPLVAAEVQALRESAQAVIRLGGGGRPGGPRPSLAKDLGTSGRGQTRSRGQRGVPTARGEPAARGARRGSVARGSRGSPVERGARGARGATRAKPGGRSVPRRRGRPAR